ncbi:MAG: hypothetical protein ACJA1U_000229 [Bermanella sp.]|jgi:hypothetical protein
MNHKDAVTFKGGFRVLPFSEAKWADHTMA